MLLKVHSASLTGLRAQILDIEVDISNSHKFHYQVVGLPDTAVRESGDRVRAATRNCGYQFPPCGAVTVNLAPADFKKEGSGYDLPIALAILGITGEITAEAVQPWLIMGSFRWTAGFARSGAPCRLPCAPARPASRNFCYPLTTPEKLE